MNDKVNWGIIGCGNVVKNKSGAFNLVNGNSISAVYGRQASKAEYVSSMFQIPKWYTSVNDLLLDKDVNAVYIATPPGLHLEHALACCEADKPVYIEKPFARNLKESQIIVNAFKAKGIPIYAAHYFRAQPKFRFVRDVISNKVIGSPVAVSFFLERKYEPLNWHYDPKLSGGGRFFDIAPHSLDLMQCLFGKFVDVHSRVSNCRKDHQVEDIVMVTFKTETGIIGSANYFLQSNRKQDKMIVFGTEENLEFSIHHGQDVAVTSAKGTEVHSFTTPQWDEQYMIQEVVNALLGKENQAVPGE